MRDTTPLPIANATRRRYGASDLPGTPWRGTVNRMAFARANRAQTTPVAIVDIGSNSTRLVVLRPDEVGGLEVVADSHIALRLVRDVDASGTIDDVTRRIEAVIGSSPHPAQRVR